MWITSLVQRSNGTVINLELRSRHIIFATGPLSTPRMPNVDGIGSFKGPTFHTAQWEHGCELKGKRVGVVGTGASAAQVITAIARANDGSEMDSQVCGVKQVFVFQRTPVWALPRNDEPTPAPLRKQIESEDGFTDRLRKSSTKDSEEILFPMLHDDSGNEELQEEVRKVIRAEIPGDSKEHERLRLLLTPTYPFFCKRVLFIDDYYKAFTRRDVTLIDGGVDRETEGGLLVGGVEYPLDVVIYATGFDVCAVPFEVVGRGGKTLAEEWGGEDLPEPRTLFGVHVSEFPNAHFMIGPQSINPVTNITLVAQDQVSRLQVQQWNQIYTWTDLTLPLSALVHPQLQGDIPCQVGHAHAKPWAHASRAQERSRGYVVSSGTRNCQGEGLVEMQQLVH
jgi:cyclohexanone monooxygenase